MAHPFADRCAGGRGWTGKEGWGRLPCTPCTPSSTEYTCTACHLCRSPACPARAMTEAAKRIVSGLGRATGSHATWSRHLLPDSVELNAVCVVPAGTYSGRYTV